MHNNDIKGIKYAIYSSFWISIVLIIVRYLSEYYHPLYLVFWRSFLGLTLIFLCFPQQKNQIFKTKKIKLFLVRALITTISMSLWFYSLSQLELPYATSLSFVAPIFTALTAIIFLGERPGIRRWSGIIIGFIGMLIIIQPGYNEIDLATYIVLLSTSLWAIISILTKKLTSTEPPIRITFYMCLFLSIFSFPLAYVYWQELKYEHFIYFLLMALGSNLSHIYLAKAFSYTDVTTILPFDFFRLIFIAIISYLAFDEMVNRYQIIGSIIIITSSVYIAHREQLAKKRAKLNTEAGK